jgi:hypothetical protein
VIYLVKDGEIEYDFKFCVFTSLSFAALFASFDSLRLPSGCLPVALPVRTCFSYLFRFAASLLKALPSAHFSPILLRSGFWIQAFFFVHCIASRSRLFGSGAP